MADVKRASRVAQRLQQELSTLLVTDVKDPRLSGVLVSRVTVSEDLRHARIFVRLLSGGDDEERREETLATLGRAAGLLRREATRNLGLRRSPELRFLYDAGQDHVDRIEELLQEVRRENRLRRSAESTEPRPSPGPPPASSTSRATTPSPTAKSGSRRRRSSSSSSS
jgi:ribosome-binding factor A